MLLFMQNVGIITRTLSTIHVCYNSCMYTDIHWYSHQDLVDYPRMLQFMHVHRHTLVQSPGPCRLSTYVTIHACTQTYVGTVSRTLSTIHVCYNSCMYTDIRWYSHQDLVGYPRMLLFMHVHRHTLVQSPGPCRLSTYVTIHACTQTYVGTVTRTLSTIHVCYNSCMYTDIRWYSH